MKKFNRLALSTALLTAMTSTSVMAGPYGYDLHNVLAPVSASMAGTSIAKPLDNVSAIFGLNSRLIILYPFIIMYKLMYKWACLDHFSKVFNT